MSRLLLALLVSSTCLITSLRAEEPPLRPKPIPRVQIIPLPYDQASVQVAGREITRFHFGRDLHRPFLYPVISPAGNRLTRMGHPHDPNGHSHHNSIWISHHDVSGVDFWGDAGKGRIQCMKINRYEDGDDHATIEIVANWIDSSNGATLLTETRTMTFYPLEENEWLLDLKSVLTAQQPEVTLGDTPFGLVGVRMAKTIGVKDGGGRILNSAGERDEKEAFRKRANWVDYSGAAARDELAGITLMSAADNADPTAPFHVRDDGWMGACFSHERPQTLKKGESVTARYGIYIHKDVLSQTEIAAQYDKFGKIAPRSASTAPQ
ncbi:PmoA family protein [Blastopirellula sp. JC732]|uniref:PmoA family protein n=1 Tax=Blastopirellula sediminis TaxID=2894196 RepID=A0A9X1SEW7_9BACT|nr:PmoA family protein [Blastopirellula sediminis]MCC9608196.1 PmoA family protein [Blastopirellula sediminis]MCC9627011.1 PmoA family protein [Blastopirellula sediminis]